MVGARWASLLSACWALAAGCTQPVGAVRDPVHVHVVCIGCSASERRVAVDGWLAEAMPRPRSTLTVWSRVDLRRPRPVIVLCVPPAWGPGVAERKAAFIHQARAAVAGENLVAGAGAAECTPVGAGMPGAERVLVLGEGLPLGAEAWRRLTTEVPAGALHAAVVCDRSNSTEGAPCTRERLGAAFDYWAITGLAAADATISVLVVGASRDSVRRLFDFQVPRRSVGERVAMVLAARTELMEALPDDVKDNASAIAEAVDVAVKHQLRERSGRAVLLLASDMRQVTRGAWNFEREVPEPDDFHQWLARHHLAPDLRAVSVRGCPVHHAAPTAGTYDAELAVRTERLWAATFRQLGATDVRLASSCDVAFAP